MSEKRLADRLRGVGKKSCFLEDISRAVFGESLSCPPNMICEECFAAVCNRLADAIEAEQSELQKCIEVLESDKDDYIESVTAFACWQMQVANMLDIPLAERNDSEEVQSKIIAALKERTKTEQNGANDLTNDLNEVDVDVDALLKLADKFDTCTQHKRSGYASMTFSTINEWADTIRDAVKGAKPQLPEGILWPTFEDGAPVRFGDRFRGYHAKSTEEHNDTVSSIHFKKSGFKINGTVNRHTYNYDEPLKRPEPEVLDADGAPSKAGDTVYGTGREQHCYTVLDPASKEFEGRFTVKCVDANDCEVCYCDPSMLTHRKPDTFEGVVAEMLADFDGSDSIELDGYFDRLRKLMGGD